MKKLFGLCLNFLVVCSCGPRESQPSRSKVILGENDLLEVTDPRFKSAVGKFTDFCTGFHIGNGLVVTAAHCLEERVTSDQGLYGVCGGDLFFEWEETIEQSLVKTKATCTRVIFREESPERDFALVEVSPVPPEALAADVEGTEQVGPGVPIEAISVPKGSPISSSGPCMLIGPDNGSRYFHDCDTSDGSSGAPVLTSSGLVIGVHNRGSKFLRKNSLSLLSGNKEIKEAIKDIR